MTSGASDGRGSIQAAGELVDVQPARRFERSAAVGPGPEPAPEVAEDRALGTDPQRLADRIVPIVRPLEDQDERPVRVDDPAEPCPERGAERDRLRARRVRDGMVGRRAQVEEQGAGRERGACLLETQRPRLRDVPFQERRPGLVGRSHPREVARHGRLATEQAGRECLDIADAEERVVAPLVADRRGRGARDAGGAERAGPVGRVDHDVIVMGEHDVMERAVHVPGVLAGVSNT